MNYATKLGCHLFIVIVTISGAYPLDFWTDPRFQHDWTGICLDGRMQSPIVVPKWGRTSISRMNLEFKNFEIPIKQVTVTNNARQTVFDWDRTVVERSVIVRAPADKVAPFKANTEYILQNIHIHHGKNNQTGTSHSVDGSFYAMEMHLLFVPREFNGNSGAAFGSLGNVMEIVVLWRESRVRNLAWSQLNNLMITANLKESEKVSGNVDIRFYDFLPRKSTYSLYFGSLMSSKCLEMITWIIYDSIMEFDTADLGMRHFTYISEGKEIPLEKNTRAIQSLNGRRIYQGSQATVNHYKRT